METLTESRTIKLANGQGDFIVSPEDYERVDAFRWWRNRRLGYIHARSGSKGERVYLHRFITNAPEGMQVDHINLDKADNRRENLRLCKHYQNCSNRKVNARNTSGYKGVTRVNAKWRALITVQSTRISLGCFPTPLLAAIAYNEAASRLHGEFAWLNPIPHHKETPGSQLRGGSSTPDLSDLHLTHQSQSDDTRTVGGAVPNR